MEFALSTLCLYYSFWMLKFYFLVGVTKFLSQLFSWVSAWDNFLSIVKPVVDLRPIMGGGLMSQVLASVFSKILKVFVMLCFLVSSFANLFGWLVSQLVFDFSLILNLEVETISQYDTLLEAVLLSLNFREVKFSLF